MVLTYQFMLHNSANEPICTVDVSAKDYDSALLRVRSLYGDIVGKITSSYSSSGKTLNSTVSDVIDLLKSDKASAVGTRAIVILEAALSCER